MFPSRRGTAIRYENYLDRVLRPATDAFGIAGLTYPMIRRSFSTMAVDNGASPKDIQHQMRHTQANMTLYYAKVIPKRAAEEVNRLAERLGKKVSQKGEVGGEEPSTPKPSGSKAHHTHGVSAKCPK